MHRGAFAKKKRWFRPLRRLDAALTPLIVWLTRSPKFVVVGTFSPAEASAAFVVERREKLVLRLHPTKSFWAWVLIGAIVSSLAILPHWLVSAVALFVGLLWLPLLLRRLAAATSSGLGQSIAGDRYLRLSPYAARRQSIMVWIPVALALILVGALTLVWNLPESFNPVASKEPNARPLLVFLTCSGMLCLVYWGVHRFRKSTLRLHDLEDWYADLPSPVQAKVRRVVSAPPRFPSPSWRHFPDMSWEVTSAGISLGLFADHNDRPIWRRSTLYVIWYFAPIVIPLFSLFATPLLQNALLGQATISDHTKLTLGVDVLVWVVWSVCYFVASGTQDFMAPSMAYGSTLRPASLVNILGYPNRELRRVAKEFFDHKGAVAFELLALMVVPLYMGYVGLLPGGSGTTAPDPSASSHDALTASRAPVDHCACCETHRPASSEPDGRAVIAAPPCGRT